jgi:hypothetical protein
LFTAYARTVAAIVSILVASVMAVVAGQRNHPSAASAIYHSDPQHLWNRLHRHLHVRTAADGREFGLDDVDPLLWRETRHLLSGPSHADALRLLDEFLTTGGEGLIADPLKRAVLQHDLWAVFDWAAETRFDGREPREREALTTRLARVIRRLALTGDQIERLPDTYVEAVRADASLPADLMAAAGDWVPLADPFSKPIARQHAAGLSRSAFSIHWNLPGGAAATTAYLTRLWEFPAPFVIDPSVAGELRAALNPELPAVPNGTRLALLRTMLVIDRAGAIVPTKIVESVQFRSIDRVHGFSEYKMQRAKLFADQAGGLRAVGDADRSFITFSSRGDDVFEEGRVSSGGEVRLSGCDNCHNSRYRPALESILSLPALLRPEVLVDARHPRYAKWRLQSSAAVEAKGARMEWGLLRGIWQSVPR